RTSPAEELEVMNRMVYYLIDLGDLTRASRVLDDAAARYPAEFGADLVEFRLVIAVEAGRWNEAAPLPQTIEAQPHGAEEARSTLIALARERDETAELGQLRTMAEKPGGLAARFVEQYLDVLDGVATEDRMDALPPARWAEISLPRSRTD